VAIEKETSLKAIMRAGVMSTPAIGIDGEIKHTGSVPNFDQVRKILEQNAVA
jgi:predicted thioredoxin/glutaredoxin